MDKMSIRLYVKVLDDIKEVYSYGDNFGESDNLANCCGNRWSCWRIASPATDTVWYRWSHHFRVHRDLSGCGVLHWHIDGEPYLNGVPLITSILAAAVLVALWSAFAYRHAYGYYSRYPYRRGRYARRRRWYRRF